MNTEQKQLLLKDLCARLPYGVICDMWFEWNEADKITEVLKCGGLMRLMNREFDFVAKPYLRPMSSMTEEELRDFAKIKFENDALWEIVEFPKKSGYKEFINVKCKNKNNGDSWIFQVNARTPLETYYGIDWLNKNHFDYRGLIPMGFALEAKEGMYKTE